MHLYPNAKINLGLNIVGRRDDGYHDIETVFYPIPLNDVLTAEVAGAFAFSQTGAALDCPPADNLVVKAIRRYADMSATTPAAPAPMPPLSIVLHKRIPAGAGLGGGSSDAAAAVRAMRSLLHLTDSDAALEAMLAPLGADCPFFVRSEPVFATGIGNVFTPISLSLAGWGIALVKPDIHVATREAYAAVRPARPAMPLTDIVRRPPGQWQHLLTNDFEPSVFAAHPRIGDIKQRLIGLGATYASMSGSGSAVYGLFAPGEPVPHLADAFPDSFTWTGQLT
ncbi:MAG: 4-(cytidine 5'-diphospho)-2-C-methyl-D-erythritol kinase [Bacteroidaceae bacterium]|nr:4-(cytidine 5'-diphospho)-2-C-methyl-D-erythritol kinase [Bacteroidaceae bacterium]